MGACLSSGEPRLRQKPQTSHQERCFIRTHMSVETSFVTYSATKLTHKTQDHQKQTVLQVPIAQATTPMSITTTNKEYLGNEDTGSLQHTVVESTIDGNRQGEDFCGDRTHDTLSSSFGVEWKPSLSTMFNQRRRTDSIDDEPNQMLQCHFNQECTFSRSDPNSPLNDDYDDDDDDGDRGASTSNDQFIEQEPRRRSTISSGVVSVVSHGEYLGKTSVIKTVHLPCPDFLKRPIIRREIELFENLSHPNIIHMYDVQDFGSCFKLVMPVCVNNSLPSYIAKHRSDGAYSLDLVFTIAVAVAKAVCYLHQTTQTSHGNIRASGILLGRNPHDGDVFLGGWGLSNILQARLCFNIAHEENSQAWDNWKQSRIFTASPELTKSNVCLLKSDVYSFGILLNFMLTGNEPYTDYPGLSRDKKLLHDIEAGLVRPRLPACQHTSPALVCNIPDGLVQLIESCWQPCPVDRPSMQRVLTTLLALRSDSKL